MTRERLGIFRMTRLPDDCRSEDPVAQSLINTVPLLIGCVSGVEPDLREARVLLNTGSSVVSAQDWVADLVAAG